MKDIDFYFSIGSTYTYLSVTRILDVEKKYQIKFNWKPFSVRMIMKEMNNIPFPKDKINKVNYMWRDIERRAEGYGFFARTPVPYPLSQFDLANQIAVLGLDKDWGVDYVRLTYKKWFQEGKEPAIDPSISEVCQELKLKKDDIIPEAKTKLIEDTYIANTNSARENKIFGSPSFVVDNEIFWGDDRMEDAIKFLKNDAPEKIL
jgi:2-hydroxychromene-2-carboxylate isomerase